METKTYTSSSKSLIFLRSIYREIKQLWTLDLRSLVVFRIGLGALLLADILFRSRDVGTFYTEQGILPATQIINWTKISNSFSIHLANDTLVFQVLLMIVAAILAVMLILGYKTKAVTVLSWIMLVSLQNRNTIVLQGGDVVFRMLLFWAIFLPIGKIFSLDSIRFKQPKIFNFKHASFASLALAIQIGIIYIFAFLLKTGVEWRGSGKQYDFLGLFKIEEFFMYVFLILAVELVFALFVVLILNIRKRVKGIYIGALAICLSVVQIAFLSLLATSINSNTGLSEPNNVNYQAVYFALGLDQFSTAVGNFLFQQSFWLRTLNIVTLMFEMIAIFLIFNPFKNWITRTFVVFGLIGMHTGFALSMDLGLFSWICIVGATSLIPTQTWDLIYQFMQNKFKKESLIIKFNPNNPSIVKFIQCVKVFLVLQNTQIIEDETIRSIKASRLSKDYFGYDVIIPIFMNSLIFRPIVRIFNLVLIRRIIISYYHHNNIAISSYELRTRFMEHPIHFMVMNFIVIFSLTLVIFWNVGDYRNESYLNDAYRDYVSFLRLDQKWNMFAPFPLKDDGWYVVEGTLDDSRLINLFESNPNLDGTKPADVSETYPTQRWRKFMMNIWSNNFSKYRNDYADYLCRKWNNYEEHEEDLEKVRIIFNLERTLPNYQVAQVEQRNLGFIKKDGDYVDSWDCFDDRNEFK